MGKKPPPKKPETKKIRIALDAMGGDNAPQEVVKGALLASEDSDIELVLVGPEDVIKEELERCGYAGSGISIVQASEVIEM